MEGSTVGLDPRQICPQFASEALRRSVIKTSCRPQLFIRSFIFNKTRGKSKSRRLNLSLNPVRISESTTDSQSRARTHRQSRVWISRRNHRQRIYMLVRAHFTLRVVVLLFRNHFCLRSLPFLFRFLLPFLSNFVLIYV